MTGADYVTFRREMAISHADFFRTLPAAVNFRDYSVDDDTVIINNGIRRVEIRLSPEGERHIASLRLPVTTIDFRFMNFTQEDIDAFIDRFDTCFQRGGG